LKCGLRKVMAGPAAAGEVWRIDSVVSTASVLGLIIIVWAALQRCVVASSTGIDRGVVSTSTRVDGSVVAAAAKDSHA
jgi:hypothetical protein